MRALAVLTEELESRTGDADRVDALARHLRAVGRAAGALAGTWLVAEPGARRARPARLAQPVLADAARALAQAHGMAPWLFDAGRAASAETAEAIALLLPWPDGAPTSASRPALADWQAGWAAAAAQSPETRASAIAQAISRLDDPIARRWAVRAVCGLVRPVVDEWQWQRAWALAFDADPHAVAWAWHRGRDVLLHDAPLVAAPRPHGFADLPDAPDALHDDLLAAWRRGELHVEPRWSGARVQVVRRGADVAVWQRGGRLLNARLPAAWLAQPWPEVGAVEAVLLARRAGRAAALDDALAARKRTLVDGATLHLALTDWHGGPDAHDQRRAHLLAHWPEPDVDARDNLPDVFTTPAWPRARADTLAAHANAARGHGWSGIVLRRRGATAAWTVRAAAHRVRAVLQYVPSDVLTSGTDAAARALAFVDCGFALWNRAPRSVDEQHAAMTAAMSGEFMPPPDDAPVLGGLRLLPLARLPMALPDEELLRLHAWLRDNAGLRFGGVHAVAPALVFELGFAAIQPNNRRKIGATLAGAHVLRWLHDAAPGDAQRLDELFPAG